LMVVISAGCAAVILGAVIVAIARGSEEINKKLFAKVRSVEVSIRNEGEGPIHRSIVSPKQIIFSPNPKEITTLYNLLQHSIEKFAGRRCFGTRTIIKIHEEEKIITKIIGGEEKVEKKIWKFFELSGYNWMTYHDVGVKIVQIGNGLVHLGCLPKSKILLFASTSKEWLLVAHGAYTQNITIVTAYETLGEEGLIHAIQQTEVKFIFTNASLLAQISKVSLKVKTLVTVIYSEEAPESLLNQVKSQGLNVFSLDELVHLGEANPSPPTPPSPDSLACIMYTSGTTGPPKGVEITHGNVIASLGGGYAALGQYLSKEDVILAYLPLAHILEFVVENHFLFLGGALGYGSPKTLSDSSVRNCKGDLAELRPTLLVGVPAVWETIRKGIVAKIKSLSSLKQKIFRFAFALKFAAMMLRIPLIPTLIDNTVFKQIKGQTGGRLQFALSGGAPLARETQKFLQITLCPLVQGYGLTETTGLVSMTDPSDIDIGRVGAPSPSVEVKLVDVPDAGYFSTNTPQQGEIWVRGPGVTSGYYKNPEITKEVYGEDGWFQTGDVGQWEKNGVLSIIDRKKNLVKLQSGEYLALERLESIYKSSEYVENICIYGDSHEAFPVAIVVPVEKELQQLVLKLRIQTERPHQHPQVKSTVLESLQALARSYKLANFETVQAVYVTEDLWTSENGMLTAATKLKRAEVRKRYEEQIQQMYRPSKKTE